MLDSTKCCVVLGMFFTLPALCGCGGVNSASTTPPPPAVHNEWTWVGGSQTADQPGIYGTKGAPSASNSPGSRVLACSWTDLSGDFWLFGGYGFASTSAMGDFNDLWEYSNGQWAWMGGSSGTEQAGVYGTLGTSAPANFPGARWQSTCWTDSQGNFWLYGGLGIDSTGARGNLGDLWRYSNGEWTWMSGSNIAAQPGITGAWQGAAVYGTEGVAAPGNTPGMRQSASGWSDPSGNLWLFGGTGAIPNGTYGEIVLQNDLWKYSNGMWTWTAGSSQGDQYGIYGALGIPAPANTPGERSGAAAWTDSSGNLWLFGGLGVGASTNGGCVGTPPCVINDLWKFSPSLNEWTWEGGPDEANEPGVYGTQGVAAPGNLPPPRNDATAWTDSAGNVWLFGGVWLGESNDLWKYSNGEWTWVSGSSQVCQEPGAYGTLGAPSAANYPGARMGAVGWSDRSGNLWLFGGGVLDCPGYPSTTKFNDLWEYTP